MSRIWVKSIDKYWEQSYIDESEFNPTKHTRLNDDDKKHAKEKAESFKEGLKIGKCAGLMMDTRNRKLGITYKDKVDEGMMGELIDQGLDEAKKRVADNKKKGMKTFRRGRHGIRRNKKRAK